MLYCSFYASYLKRVGIWINKTLFLKHSVYSCIVATRICSKNSLLITPKTKRILKVEYLAVKHPLDASHLPSPHSYFRLLTKGVKCASYIIPAFCHLISGNTNGGTCFYPIRIYPAIYLSPSPFIIRNALRMLSKIQIVLSISVKCTQGRWIQMKFEKILKESVKALWPRNGITNNSDRKEIWSWEGEAQPPWTLQKTWAIFVETLDLLEEASKDWCTERPEGVESCWLAGTGV